MRLASWISALTLAADQATKYVVVQAMDLQTRMAIDVVPPFLSLRMAWNRGVNFGLFAHDAEMMRWVLITLALAISAWVWSWVRRDAPNAPMQIAAGLLVGGALGNVIDRLAYGAVADFLNMSCCGLDNPFSFNIADVAIFAGAIGIVVFSGRHKTP